MHPDDVHGGTTNYFDAGILTAGNGETVHGRATSSSACRQRRAPSGCTELMMNERRGEGDVLAEAFTELQRPQAARSWPSSPV